MLGLRSLLGLKAKTGFLMPLLSLELGLHRQGLGLQSRYCLPICVEGHGLPHPLQVRKLRGSLEYHTCRGFPLVGTTPVQKRITVGGDGLCPSHPLGKPLTSYREETRTQVEGRTGVTSHVSKETNSHGQEKGKRAPSSSLETAGGFVSVGPY